MLSQNEYKCHLLRQQQIWNLDTASFKGAWSNLATKKENPVLQVRPTQIFTILGDYLIFTFFSLLNPGKISCFGGMSLQNLAENI